MSISLLTQLQVAPLLEPRARDSHKGMFGTVTVIGGDHGMVGAALLAGRAALKLGAGQVHVGLLAEQAPLLDLLQPELMLHHAEQALRISNKSPRNILAIGCGLGVSGAAHKLLHDALRLDLPSVLDADALNLLAARPDLRALLLARSAATVLTPHPGEAARLLSCSTAEVQADRPAAVRELAERFASLVVLKGADSLIADRQGELVQNTRGNPGMSGPGMGDVLTGMIAAFIAQGLPAGDATRLAVYLHGAAGDTLADQGIRLGMCASELIDCARSLLNQWSIR